MKGYKPGTYLIAGNYVRRGGNLPKEFIYTEINKETPDSRDLRGDIMKSISENSALPIRKQLVDEDIVGEYDYLDRIIDESKGKNT